MPMQGVKEEEEWRREKEREPEPLQGFEAYLRQLYVVVRESLLMAPLMPGAYLHAFLALRRGLAAANAAATIYCVDGGKTPCAPFAGTQVCPAVPGIGASHRWLFCLYHLNSLWLPLPHHT